ncbi:TetR family transcriptional regulator [Dietzia sp. NCCP-2495]|uniref:TetR/AcrR family transcriptional regulator n=1 Tax=Dietzia sp. NCCP-2495 TaxID=2934675 RepID=UPI00222FCB17|nr:TetR/AcrR family transcriptional regulator [Dietzia sp. NCCP-2495]GLB64208.1 TetR family transcriptional regulator [Dietzia sp. NCCP-2495]
MRSRDIILEATRAQIGASGFEGVSIAGVAKRAGVSRQTVYSIFGTREELVSQALTDRLTQLLGSFEKLLAAADSLLELFVEMVVEARAQVLGDPMLQYLTLSGTANPIFDAGAAERALEYGVALLSPAADRFPEMAGRVERVADLAVHVGWSVLCLDRPETRSDDALREVLTTWVAPTLASLTR